MPSPRDHAVFAYRTALVFGMVIVGLSLLAGIGAELFGHRRLPGLRQDPLAGGAQALSRGESRRALREFTMAAFLNSGDYSVLLAAADGLFRAGDIDGALVILDQADRLRPYDTPALVARGLALRRQGKTQAALAAFSQAIERNPQDPKAFAAMGETLLDQDRYADAIRYFTRSIERQPNGSVHNGLGIAYALSGQPERAIEHFKRAAALDPGLDVSANIARAQAALRPHGSSP